MLIVEPANAPLGDNANIAAAKHNGVECFMEIPLGEIVGIIEGWIGPRVGIHIYYSKNSGDARPISLKAIRSRGAPRRPGNMYRVDVFTRGC